MTTATVRALQPVRYSLEDDEGQRALVAGLMVDDSDAVSFLHDGMVRGLRFYFVRRLGPAYKPEYIHDTLIQALQQIQKGDLGKPGSLVGFLRTIASLKVCEVIRERLQTGNTPTPLDTPVAQEEDAERNDTMALFRKTLDKMNRRDREVLDRFYLLEQTKEQICLEMDLTEDEFRLLKSRAKARFDDIGKKISGRQIWEVGSAQPEIQNSTPGG
jgi:RNA polymerase sigma-70 factor (ECF subfamily)